MTISAPVAPVMIGGVPVHPITLAQTLAFVRSVASSGAQATVFNVNAHAINLAADDPRFRAALASASLVFCDGKAVQWASRLLGRPLPERFTPPDWVDELCEMAVRERYRLFFLGAEEGVAETAAERLRSRHEGVEIRTSHGYFERIEGGSETVVRAVNEHEPHILLVGLGMPRQEVWITENLEHLSARVAISVGGMFDFLSGRTWRAPRWITDAGFEWLARFLTEPWRLGRRYLIGNPRFMVRVGRQLLEDGRRGG